MGKHVGSPFLIEYLVDLLSISPSILLGLPSIAGNAEMVGHCGPVISYLTQVCHLSRISHRRHPPKNSVFPDQSSRVFLECLEALSIVFFA